MATDAQALLGEFLKQQPKNTGTAGLGRPTLGGYKTEPPKSNTPTLSDLHINKRESSEAQFLAEVKEEEPRRSARYPAHQAIDGDLT